MTLVLEDEQLLIGAVAVDAEVEYLGMVELRFELTVHTSSSRDCSPKVNESPSTTTRVTPAAARTRSPAVIASPARWW